MLEGGGELGEAGGIDVADGDDFKIAGRAIDDVEACAVGLRGGGQGCGFLADEDGDAVLSDGIKELGDGLVAEVGEVGSVEGGVAGKVVGKVEAEGNFALEPGFYGVAIRGDDIKRIGAGESIDMQISHLSKRIRAVRVLQIFHGKEQHRSERDRYRNKTKQPL